MDPITHPDNNYIRMLYINYFRSERMSNHPKLSFNYHIQPADSLFYFQIKKLLPSFYLL
jgi:hypothetical protein